MALDLGEPGVVEAAGGMRADGLAASRSASALAGLAAPARVRPV
jgi:hypothetical protein